MGFQLTTRYADPRVIPDEPPPVDPAGVAAARAVKYTINSSAGALSREARDALSGIAHRIGRMLIAPVPEGHGAAEHWRTIAAVALQMEARAMGLDYTSCMNDKSLTPD